MPRCLASSHLQMPLHVKLQSQVLGVQDTGIFEGPIQPVHPHPGKSPPEEYFFLHGHRLQPEPNVTEPAAAPLPMSPKETGSHS